jgi:hypothetical protein
MNININDPTLTKLLLEHMVEQAEAGGLDDLLASGLRPELVDDLRQRPLRDFYYAAQHGGLAMSVQIDVRALETCLWRRDQAKHTEMLKEYFIRNGASIDLLRTLFTLSKQELQRYRSDLDLSKSGSNGRPRMPPASIRDKIHQRWHDIVQAQPQSHDRYRLWLLHQDYSAYSISALHRVITEFDDNTSAMSPRMTPSSPLPVPPDHLVAIHLVRS